jgi:hypothetical protein
MPCHESRDVGVPEGGTRLNYFDGRLLSADDLRTEH